MTKDKLKEEFFERFDNVDDHLAHIVGSPESIWNFFEPYLKLKSPKPKIEIPKDKLIAFNECFPEGKSGSGKRMRCNVKELEKAFQYFFKLYPDTQWSIILQATQLYLSDQEKDNFKWCRTAKYFCIKFKQPGQPESELIEYCERILSGEQIETGNAGFDVKVL